MKVAIIDLETTGLDPIEHQILQIGVVYQDLSKDKFEESIINSLELRVLHSRIVGDPIAIGMNAQLIKDMAGMGSVDPRYCEPWQIMARMHRFFVDKCGYSEAKPYRLYGGGKNFGSFDLQFLKNCTEYGKYFKFHHRSVDPGPMFLNPNDSDVKSIDQIMEYLGISHTSTHEAVDDCMMVAKALWYGCRSMKPQILIPALES